MTRRQALGMLLAVCIVLTGRSIRNWLLIDNGNNWRDPLWLDNLLPAEVSHPSKVPVKQTLTSPLPINICSRDSLMLLPGVGPVLADRIETARATGIFFYSPADLEQIKGIGPRLSERMSPWLDFRQSLSNSQE